MKTVYNLHRFWTSMSAIFGFTFHIGRMTEVLTPDLYRAHCLTMTNGGVSSISHAPEYVPLVSLYAVTFKLCLSQFNS